MEGELEVPNAQTIVSKLKLPLLYYCLFRFDLQQGFSMQAFIQRHVYVCDCVYTGVIVREAGVTLSPSQPISSPHLYLPMRIT